MEKEAFMEKLLSFMKEEAYKPLTVQELEEMLNITEAEEFKELVKALVALEEKGLIVRTRSDRYGIPEKMNLIKGKISAHAKGFAFLLPEDTSLSDVFIPPNELNTAMNGDIVMVRLNSQSSGAGRRNRHTDFRKSDSAGCRHVYRNEKLRLCHSGRQKNHE